MHILQRVIVMVIVSPYANSTDSHIDIHDGRWTRFTGVCCEFVGMSTCLIHKFSMV